MDPRFADYVTERWDALIRYAAVVSGDSAEAESVVRTVLTKLATRSSLRRNRDGLDDPDKLDVDVRTAVVRTLISRWRRQGIALDEPPAPEVAVYDASTSLDRPVTPAAALRQMPPRQRAMLALRFLDDRGEVETAAVLRCSADAVRTQTLGALAILRQRFPDLVDPVLDSDRLPRP